VFSCHHLVWNPKQTAGDKPEEGEVQNKGLFTYKAIDTHLRNPIKFCKDRIMDLANRLASVNKLISTTRMEHQVALEKNIYIFFPLPPSEAISNSKCEKLSKHYTLVEKTLFLTIFCN